MKVIITMPTKGGNTLYNMFNIPEVIINILSASTVCLLSLALTTRHTLLLVSFVMKTGRLTEILEMLASVCSLLSDCDKFLHLLRSCPRPNITVQDLSPFVCVVFTKIHVILSVSISNVKSTSKN